MSETQTQTRDWIGLINAIRGMDNVSEREAVERLRAQAMAYVWGWQDAGGSERDSDVSWHFATAYGWHAFDYATGRTGMRRNIQGAFEEWRTSRTVAGVAVPQASN